MVQRMDARKADAKAARVALTVETLPVGTILAHCWGWEQSNCDFYKVMEHKGKCSVILAPIGCVSHPSPGFSPMSDHVTPDAEKVDDARIVCRMATPDRVNIPHARRYSWGRTASKWDGSPLYRSWYA
jgi:hypothetical protein